MTARDRIIKAERNQRRGRTPAFLQGKLWEKNHVKRKRWSLDALINKERRERAAKEDRELDEALGRMRVEKNV